MASASAAKTVGKAAPAVARIATSAAAKAAAPPPYAKPAYANKYAKPAPAPAPPPQAPQLRAFPPDLDVAEEHFADVEQAPPPAYPAPPPAYPAPPPAYPAPPPAAAPSQAQLQLAGGEGLFGKIVNIPGEAQVDSSLNFQNISSEPFAKEVAEVLMAPVDPMDVEIKPDGLIYLPEIKYRRVLLRAFGPGGWGLVPRSQHTIEGDTLSREYALFASGRFVAQARGEQQYFKGSSVATASEGAKSNALMRCCKDLGIAGELWDPNFILQWRNKYAVNPWCVHATTNKKQRLWRRVDRAIGYPWAEASGPK